MSDPNASAAAQAALAADLDRLQYVLLKVLDNEHGRGVVEDELLPVPAASAGAENDGAATSSDGSGGVAAAAASNKRKRLERCVRCEKEYEVGADGPQACVWHSGYLKYDTEFWRLRNGDCHGPVETEENVRRFPERFWWVCCERPGNARGCESWFHYPSESSGKRNRV